MLLGWEGSAGYPTPTAIAVGVGIAGSSNTTNGGTPPPLFGYIQTGEVSITTNFPPPDCLSVVAVVLKIFNKRYKRYKRYKKFYSWLIEGIVRSIE
jgi:hypothetical protein